ncbi:unnamed protein product [Phaedon cochleariae]|uniref:Low molecular weight phosphotyrosine protein phosphatase n=1 Tax=Phaedon cochleariae TaxID=80249 RepID=A0A9N9SAX8_PHACE|nr:unnamed protein product [Phaedon cochleariae]
MKNMVQEILFVCLGNICRSPIAHAVFQHIVKEKGIADQWVIDSAAVSGRHNGSPPNSRARQVLESHNMQCKRRARQIKDEDFNRFDYIFGMDEHNISSLKDQAPRDCKAKILLLGDFDPEGDRIIQDPYFENGTEGFEKCYQQCMRSCTAFLEQL